MALKCILFVVVTVASGCKEDGVGDYQLSIKSAKHSLPFAVEMERLYRDADHFVTHFGAKNSPLEWNTMVWFGDRYILTMKVMVSVDYNKNVIAPLAEPVFILHEVTGVNKHSGGRIGASYGGKSNQITFGTKEWNALYESGGDYGVIGIDVNGPMVLDFEEYIKGLRKDRIPITLLKNEH